MPSARRSSGTEPSAGFRPALFRFLKEIAKNNNKAWFTANKERYLGEVQAPALEFVRAVGPKLGRISRHLVADPRPVGGSVMRIYRDIRFSRDKSPYRTAVGIRFMNQTSSQEGEHAPGFFLHLAPGDSWAYGGVWRLDGPPLDAVRHAIAERPSEWRKVRAAVPEIEGEALQRVPSGFDPAHPYAADLKRKGFSAGVAFRDEEVLGPGFPERFVRTCRTLTPLNRFLSDAMGLDY